MVTPVCETVLPRFSRPRYTGRNWVAGPGQAGKASHSVSDQECARADEGTFEAQRPKANARLAARMAARATYQTAAKMQRWMERTATQMQMRQRTLARLARFAAGG